MMWSIDNLIRRVFWLSGQRGNSGFLETIPSQNLCSWIKFFLQMFHRCIFLVLIVHLVFFAVCARCFQPYMNITCRSTQNAACTKRTKTLKYKHINKIFIKLKHKSSSKHVLSNSRHLALIFGACSKVRTSWPYRWFWKIFERFR